LNILVGKLPKPGAGAVETAGTSLPNYYIVSEIDLKGLHESVRNPPGFPVTNIGEPRKFS
jgi:hypothetical protein